MLGFIFLNSVAMAAPTSIKQDISLRAAYWQGSEKVCETQRSVKSGVSYLWCENKLSDGTRILIKLNAEWQNASAIRVAAQVEQIAPDGSYMNVGRPEILAMQGEPSTIEVGEKSTPIMKLEVLAKADESSAKR